MFGGLKKKLQEAVKKVTGQIEESKPEQSKLQPVEEIKKELEVEQPKLEQIFKEEKKEEKTEPIPETREEIKETIALPKEAQNIHKEPEAIKKVEHELEKTGKEEKEEQMIVPSQIEKEVTKIVKEEEKIYDREQEVEKKIDKLKEREIEEEVLKQNRIKQEVSKVQESKEEKKRFGLFKKITEKKLTEDDVSNILKELEMAMMENDVAVEVVEKISSSLKKDLVGASVKRGEAEKTITNALRKAMLSVLGTENIEIEKLIQNSNEPITVVMLGFNGVGKTTTLSKLAYRYKKYSPVLAAGDTFRAASIEQLEEHSKRLDVKLVKSKYGADSAAVIFDAKKHAAAIGSKIVFADTAGRSHTNVNLMDELRKVVRVNKPDLKVLVLDSLAGNDIYEQARLFDEAVGVDAVILTKSDVYDRGGAALSAAYALKKPILFLGTGQEYTDLIEFSPEVIVKNLLE